MTNTTNYLAGASMDAAQELAETAEQILSEYDAFLRARGLTRLEPEKPGPASEILQAQIKDTLDEIENLPVRQTDDTKGAYEVLKFPQQLQQRIQATQKESLLEARRAEEEQRLAEFDQLSEIEEQQIRSIQNGIELSNLIERG